MATVGVKGLKQLSLSYGQSGFIHLRHFQVVREATVLSANWALDALLLTQSLWVTVACWVGLT